jgi:hypothetical protein
VTTAELIAITARLTENPIWEGYSGPTTGMIATAAGVTNREVQEALEQAKREGAPIIANGAGVRVASSSAEMFAYYRSLRGRFVTQAANTRGVLRGALRMQKAEDAAVTPPSVLFPELEQAA